MKTRRLLPALLTLGIATLPLAVQAETGNGDLLENTGFSCLAGGAILGTAALLVGPTVAVSVAGSSVMPTAIGTGLSAMFGCGLGAASTLVYHGYRWTENALFGEPAYPTLYPLREELQTDTGAAASGGQ